MLGCRKSSDNRYRGLLYFYSRDKAGKSGGKNMFLLEHLPAPIFLPNNRVFHDFPSGTETSKVAKNCKRLN
jgi:hypothetical protein